MEMEKNILLNIVLHRKNRKSAQCINEVAEYNNIYIITRMNVFIPDLNDISAQG